MLNATASLLALSLAAAPSPAPFLNDMPKSRGVYELKHDWLLDGILTGAAAAAWFVSEVPLKPALAPSTCRWCDRLPDGTDTLNPVDAWARGARWGPAQQKTADLLSSVTVVAVPVAMLGADAYLAGANGALEEVPVDALILAESLTLSGVLNQAVKFVAGRERPFVHVLPADQKGLPPSSLDNNVSFYSGHTNMAFNLVVAAGTVAELRGYEGRWLIWAVGLPLAAATGYLRMAADKHYLTDVFTGALVGSAIGFAVPALMHGRTVWKPSRKHGLEAQLTAGPGGVGLAGRF